ncbi:ADP-ribosylation factor-like protein 13B [Branchiostoma lanceolatum]|uniref:ADP-ribosylation factor-like protein 13B n=1 Tax=Branchiostoma lanceolatum TaxID=7740 RepID=UPI001132D8AB
MLSMMGGCLSGLLNKEDRRSVTLLTVGLDNAGKTSTIKVVSGESPEGVSATVGFSPQEFKLGRYDITTMDLGGGKGIRGIWHRYYAEAHGSVFVVDASDRARFDEARTVLEDFLGDPRISGKPVLVLANKQDVEGAADENDVCSVLYLEQMVNKYRCPCKIELSSTAAGFGKKVDPNISTGFRWLLDQIGKDFSHLSIRIEKDLEEQKEKDEQEKKERRERVAKAREERRIKEEEEARREGRTIEKSDDEQEEADFEGNPFKPMDRVRADLAKRDQEKKDRKLREAAEMEENEEKKKKKKKKKKAKDQDNEQLERLEGKERSEEDTTTSTSNNHSSSHSDASPQQSSRKDDEDEGIEITPSNSDLGQQKTEESREERKERKKKKKRKMKKNNRVSPGDADEPEQNDTPFPSPRGARAILPPIGPPGDRMLGGRASRKPVLEPLTEPSNEGVAKWSLAEDLEEPLSVRPFRPNSDDADIIT